MRHGFKLSLLTALVLLIASSGVYSAASAPRVDKLPSVGWWRSKIQSQANAHANRRYNGCLFGDSISSGLGNTLGQSTANFAIGGLSSVSLLEQLKRLKAANVQCQKAVIAIGTNDAMYAISNFAFKRNLHQIITLVRTMGTNDITVLPAFYSTIEASQDPDVAGSLDRVDQISSMIQQVAEQEDVPLVATDLQPLFRDHSLKAELTFDGVHLNNDGKRIYRQLIIKLFNSAVSSR